MPILSTVDVKEIFAPNPSCDHYIIGLFFLYHIISLKIKIQPSVAFSIITSTLKDVIQIKDHQLYCMTDISEFVFKKKSIEKVV